MAQRRANNNYLQLDEADDGLVYVQVGNESGLWMSKRSPADKINDEFSGKIDSVRGPPAAPIGFNVHKLAIAGGDPYAYKHVAEEPVKGIQHQPVLLPADFYGPPKPEPELDYRQEMGSKGVRAIDATLDKLVAAGMTPGPKVRFDNSILSKDLPPELDPNAGKKENKKVSADPNAGAPKDP